MDAYPNQGGRDLPPTQASPSQPQPHITERGGLDIQPGHAGFSSIGPSPGVAGAPDMSARYANPPGAYEQSAPAPQQFPGTPPSQSPSQPGAGPPPAPAGTPVSELDAAPNKRRLTLTDVPQLIELRQGQPYFLCEFILEGTQPFSGAVCDQSQYQAKQYSFREYSGTTRGTASNLISGSQQDYYLILKADHPTTVFLTLNYAPPEIVQAKLAEARQTAPKKKGFPWLLVIAIGALAFVGYKLWKKNKAQKSNVAKKTPLSALNDEYPPQAAPVLPYDSSDAAPQFDGSEAPVPALSKPKSSRPRRHWQNYRDES